MEFVGAIGFFQGAFAGTERESENLKEWYHPRLGRAAEEKRARIRWIIIGER